MSELLSVIISKHNFVRSAEKSLLLATLGLNLLFYSPYFDKLQYDLIKDKEKAQTSRHRKYIEKAFKKTPPIE